MTRIKGMRRKKEREKGERNKRKGGREEQTRQVIPFVNISTATLSVRLRENMMLEFLQSKRKEKGRKRENKNMKEGKCQRKKEDERKEKKGKEK